MFSVLNVISPLLMGINADTAFFDPEFLEDFDGIGNTAFQHIEGIHQQAGIFRIDAAIRTEGLQFRIEHLHPGMGHGTAGPHAVELVGDGAGGAVAAADIGGPGA